MLSFRSGDDTGEEWNMDTFLEMTNTVREALKTGFIPSAEAEIISELLSVLLADEKAQQNLVDLDLVMQTHLDKFLEDVVKVKDEFAQESRFREIITRANSLQRKWQQRFKEEYFEIDEERTRRMKSTGILRGLQLNPGDWTTTQVWQVSKNEPISHTEGDLGFDPGRYWTFFSSPQLTDN